MVIRVWKGYVLQGSCIGGLAPKVAVFKAWIFGGEWISPSLCLWCLPLSIPSTMRWAVLQHHILPAMMFKLPWAQKQWSQEIMAKTMRQIKSFLLKKLFLTGVLLQWWKANTFHQTGLYSFQRPKGNVFSLPLTQGFWPHSFSLCLYLHLAFSFVCMSNFSLIYRYLWWHLELAWIMQDNLKVLG